MSCTKGIEHGTGLRMSEILHEKFPWTTRLRFFPGRTWRWKSLADCRVRRFSVAVIVRGRRTSGRSGERAFPGLLQRRSGRDRARRCAEKHVRDPGRQSATASVSAIIRKPHSSPARSPNCSGSGLHGGDARTFQGLSGAGDLIATCFSQHSRNRRLGEQLGQGRSLEDITRGMKTVAEGIPTARSAFECARNVGVETPIIDQVYAVLHEAKSPAQAMQELLGRDQKSERG